tara:strand:- start:84 stop:278 length:195 start_codon:yes stop_codon:yes gene_type:complete
MESKPIVVGEESTNLLNTDSVSRERLTDTERGAEKSGAEDSGLDENAPSNINVRRSSNVRVKQP